MENQVNNAATAAQEANVQNAEEQKVQNVEQSTESMQLSIYDKIVADLIKKNKLYKNYKIKSCKCTPKENYNLISYLQGIAFQLAKTEHAHPIQAVQSTHF